jgi:phosphomannomutase/phosphoglucomutase
LRLDPTVFREYDIRGIAWENLDPQVFTVLGAAFGTIIRDQGGGRVVVGRDGRITSPNLCRAFVAGLLGAGCEAHEIGLVTTPMVYFAIKHLSADGGAAVTASHNPAEYNGLKLRTRDQPLSGEDIQHLRQVAENGPFSEGVGHRVSVAGIVDDYLSAIAQRLRVEKGFKVVVDAGNGAAGLVAPELFRQLGCEVTELYCGIDGRFPHHLPDPSEEKNLHDLVTAVKEHQADAGFAYDGDGDRLGLVTNEGEVLSGDLILALMAGEVLKRQTGTVVFDLLSSRSLIDVIHRHGGIPVMAPTGYTRVMAEVKRTGALMGGEASGHIFLNDELFDSDDGIFASAKVLEALSGSRRKLSELAADIPRYCSGPEVKLPCSDEHKFMVMDRIREHFRERFEVVDLDGLRIEFEQGWASVRASHTTPNVALVFEAQTPESLAEIKTSIMREITVCCAGEISAGVLGLPASG